MNKQFYDFINSASEVIGSLLLLFLAIIMAWFIKRLTIFGLGRMDFDQKLERWGLAKNPDESKTYIETIASMFYFVVVLLFLPSILKGLNLYGVLDPIQEMFSGFINNIPYILSAGIILVIGIYFCNFIRTLIKNLLDGLNIDKWFYKLMNQGETIQGQDGRFAEGISTIIYALIFIPILTVALRTLNMPTISSPIIELLNQILSAIPKIIVASILLIVGSFVAKLIADLINSLLKTSGVDTYSKYLNFKGESSILISDVTSGIVRAVLLLFFAVEAMSVMDLKVLNHIGAMIISYLPLILSSVALLGFGIIVSNTLSQFLSKVSGSPVFGEVVRYAIIILTVFMTLDQLQLAKTIVNASFIIILSGVVFAIALAFGLGGRDFAAKQLERADREFNEDKQDSSQKDPVNTQK
ncbi:mechanosensitive ion channel [Hutsoniella sourekii]|uniref:mechanosensitive ion channel n=1 Tax=Hutsoniella sourekii TaxID=87650 RepID=UPI00048401A7|nr:mechanosensitive ion channel [Hutsoniella sourekii]